ncbi:redox-sensitive transcriptional activator SoxR [Pseudonocardia saturnea]|nr:redox-sensitive transcriptional activator SoxR [Pseudonocardia autotrophica]GEC28076.1 redox-sensitive transcriptional activator SoxR [Pseudonocardia saturnea]
MEEMESSDLLTIGEIVERSGFPHSALRYYEREGLIAASRTSGGQRRYRRSVLRRLAFVRAARSLGIGLDEVRAALDSLPAERTPTRADWSRLSKAWRNRLDEQIDALTALRDGLDGCIGCGCLSMTTCRLVNPEDAAAVQGDGARRLPPALRRPPVHGR